MGCVLRVRISLKMTDNKQRNPQAVCLSFKKLLEDLNLVFHLAIEMSNKMWVFSKLSGVSNWNLSVIKRTLPDRRGGKLLRLQLSSRPSSRYVNHAMRRLNSPIDSPASCRSKMNNRSNFTATYVASQNVVVLFFYQLDFPAYKWEEPQIITS